MDHLSRRDCLVAGLALAATPAAAAAQPPRLALPAGPPGSLRALASGKGLINGAAVDVPWLADRRLVAALAGDCNVLGVANGFTWDRIQRKPGPIDPAEPEAICRAAAAGHQLVRGHNLVWNDATLPGWLLAAEAGMTASQAAARVHDHVRDCMMPFRGRVFSQDVVNEPIDADGVQNRLWFRKLGEQYIDVAFHAAAQADPDCDRTLNQDWIELDTGECLRRRNSLLGLLERLLKRGVPIQTVGIEGHLDSRFPFSETVWRRFLDEVTGMGLKLLVTEYDVNDHAFAGDPAQRDAQSAALLGAFLSVTLSYPNCTGLVSQSWSDRFDWYEIVGDYHDDGSRTRPNPLDLAYRRKPQYDAIAAAIRSAPARSAKGADASPGIGRAPPRDGRAIAPWPAGRQIRRDIPA